MIYLRTQITKMGVMQTLFDMTIRNTGDSPDAGSENSKVGNYEVVLREQDRCAVTKTRVLSIKGFPRKKYSADELILLALYGMLGAEQCNKLFKEMKNGISDSKTRRAKPKEETPQRGRGRRAVQPAQKSKVVYGGGSRSK